MIRNDYIMRQIELFAIFAQRLAQHFKTGDLNSVESDLDATSRYFTGLRFSIIRNMDSEEIIRMLSIGSPRDIHKLYVLGSLFEEEARLANVRGNESQAFDSGVKALRLQIEVLNECGADSSIGALVLERIDGLFERLSEFELSEDLSAIRRKRRIEISKTEQLSSTILS